MPPSPLPWLCSRVQAAASCGLCLRRQLGFSSVDSASISRLHQRVFRIVPWSCPLGLFVILTFYSLPFKFIGYRLSGLGKEWKEWCVLGLPCLAGNLLDFFLTIIPVVLQ